MWTLQTFYVLTPFSSVKHWTCAVECERIGITALVKVVPEDRCAGHRFGSHPESRENSSAAGQSVVQLKKWRRFVGSSSFNMGWSSSWGCKLPYIFQFWAIWWLVVVIKRFINYMSKLAQNNWLYSFLGVRIVAPHGCWVWRANARLTLTIWPYSLSAVISRSKHQK